MKRFFLSLLMLSSLSLMSNEGRFDAYHMIAYQRGKRAAIKVQGSKVEVRNVNYNPYEKDNLDILLWELGFECGSNGEHAHCKEMELALLQYVQSLKTKSESTEQTLEQKTEES